MAKAKNVVVREEAAPVSLLCERIASALADERNSAFINGNGWATILARFAGACGYDIRQGAHGIGIAFRAELSKLCVASGVAACETSRDWNASAHYPQVRKHAKALAAFVTPLIVAGRAPSRASSAGSTFVI